MLKTILKTIIDAPRIAFSKNKENIKTAFGRGLLFLHHHFSF